MPGIPDHIKDKMISRTRYAVEEKIARRVRAALGLSPAIIKKMRNQLWADRGYTSDWELVRALLHELLAQGPEDRPVAMHAQERKNMVEAEAAILDSYPVENGWTESPVFLFLWPNNTVSVVTMMSQDDLPDEPPPYSVLPYHGRVCLLCRSLEDYAATLRDKVTLWRQNYDL
jgi:hypothetical protein